ncbi:MAG: TRAP transporter small permease [Pseudomonadota bacterium]
MSAHTTPREPLDGLEEGFIAVTLGLMTLVTFANVVARYVFNSNILWALEVTVFLFAWLVLIGASYGVKKTFHIGVDVVVNLLPAPARRVVTLLAGAACLAFAVLLLIGAWNYWWPFATTRAFYETDDVPVPFFLTWMGDVLNDGEAYEKLPRFIPYMALPIGMALLVFRFIQAIIRVLKGEQDLLIAGHEAETEDALEDVYLDANDATDGSAR